KLIKRLRNFHLLPLLLCTVVTVYGQNETTITGTVYGETGTMPLPGVNITVEGKSIGTTSDFDGKYSINVTPSDVLVFSYIGFKEVKRRSEEHTSELQSRENLVCRLLLE